MVLRHHYKTWKGPKHIRVKTEKTTAIAYINNMGGTVHLKCNVLALEIWEHCIGKQAWISAEHVPGREN